MQRAASEAIRNAMIAQRRHSGGCGPTSLVIDQLPDRGAKKQRREPSGRLQRQ